MQFLQYDEFRTRLRKVGDLHGKSRPVVSDIRRVMLLYNTYLHISNNIA
jgi:hypothetical protein